MNEYELIVQPGELWDPIKEEFVYMNSPVKLKLKHSLRSVAKWECKHKKSFFTDQITDVEMFKDYVKCMTVNGNFDDVVYDSITFAQMKGIERYIDDPMTASTYHDFSKSTGSSRGLGKMTTAEDLYYAMFELGIPLECEKWHLNRLVALIRFMEVRGGNGKKMSAEDTIRQYASINAKRRAKHRTRG